MRGQTELTPIDCHFQNSTDSPPIASSAALPLSPNPRLELGSVPSVPAFPPQSCLPLHQWVQEPFKECKRTSDKEDFARLHLHGGSGVWGFMARLGPQDSFLNQILCGHECAATTPPMF